MIELDLHGERHEAAQKLLERTINRLWASNDELKIITGNSPRMKAIVIDLLTQYKLEYKIGDFSGMNMGYITTTLEA